MRQAAWDLAVGSDWEIFIFLLFKIIFLKTFIEKCEVILNEFSSRKGGINVASHLWGERGPKQNGTHVVRFALKKPSDSGPTPDQSNGVRICGHEILTATWPISVGCALDRWHLSLSVSFCGTHSIVFILGPTRPDYFHLGWNWKCSIVGPFSIVPCEIFFFFY